MIKETFKWVLWMWYMAAYYIFSLLLLPIYFTIQCIKVLYQFGSVNEKINGFVNVVKNTIQRIYDFVRALNARTYFTRPSFLRQIRISQQVANILHRSSSQNSEQITQNQKVLLLMQKMRKLEETIFQESIDRRKAEQELFDLKIQFSQRNGALIRERSENVQNLNKLNNVKFQLAQKQDELDKSMKHVADLEKQLKDLKQKLETLQAAKENIQEERNEQNKNVEVCN